MCEPLLNDLSSTLETGKTIQPKSRTLDEIIDHDEKSILEGWCPKRENDGLFDVNFDNPSLLGNLEYDWDYQENPNSAFKNALNNLSDGLAYMHKKNIQQNEPKEAQVKKKTYRIKSMTTVQKTKKHPDIKVKSLNHDEKDKENILESQHEREIPSISNIIDETNTSTKTPNDLSILQFKFDRQSTPLQETNFMLIDPPSKRNSYVKHEKNSDFMKYKDSRFLNTIDYNPDLLKVKTTKSKPNETDQNSLILSDNEEKTNFEPKFEKILLPVKFKSVNTQRSTRTARSENQKANQTLMYPKVVSPKDMLQISNEHAFLKREPTPPISYTGNTRTLLNQKEFNFPSSLQRMEDLKSKKIKECEGFTEFATQIMNRKSNETTSMRNEERNSILNAVMGKAFNPNKAPPLFNLNLKGSKGQPQGKQLRINDENSREPLINISTINVDKSDYSLKPLDPSFIKKIDPKTKMHDHSKILGSDILEALKEKNTNLRDPMTKPVLKSIHKKEIVMSSKRLNTNQDDKKVLVTGKVNFNEILF